MEYEGSHLPHQQTNMHSDSYMKHPLAFSLSLSHSFLLPTSLSSSLPPPYEPSTSGILVKQSTTEVHLCQIIILSSLKIIFILCVYLAYIYMQALCVCVPGTNRGQKLVLDPLEEELKMIVCCHEGAGN